MYKTYIQSIGLFWYRPGAIIKNNNHQTIIKKLTNDVRIKLWENIQTETNTAMPKEIIDQGWHQKGLRFQKFFS